MNYNKIKRTFLVLMIAIFLLTLLSAPAMAADEFEIYRTISNTQVNSGETVRVTLVLTANKYIEAPSVEEKLPSGWVLNEVSNDGATYKNTTTEWIWAESMNQSEQNMVEYDLTVPSGTTDGTYSLSGSANAFGIPGINIKVDYIIVDDWNPWNDPDSDSGESITLVELQDAIYCWRFGEPASTGEMVDLVRLQDLIYSWRFE